MKYIFGPVPSRRLGQSLGIDTIPLKTCNWNCVYCQLGRSMPLINERREYIPREEILAEVKQSLNAHQPGEIDWITFVGSGEPTLHSGIGWLIREIKTISDLPIAVITNGSLLYLPEIQEELMPADAVLPSLDAGCPERYRRINRPHPEITFERLLDGLVSFQRQYQGKLWVEVMLIKDTNDTESALEEIAAALKLIQPDEVHIVLPTRPPAETWVQPSGEEGLLRARAILGKVAQVIHPATGSFDFSGSENLIDAIIGIITRHPMREDELIKTLNQWAPETITQTLNDLANSKRAQVIERYDCRFWSAAQAYYPSE
ncbi:MAG: radical SAM protein [Chloroflexota bacterium]|nr:MAG: radical SAM protein [Chloroflexota bacterium]